MSEIKRVALSTFEPQKVSDKVNKKTCKTIRISVILPESNEDNCPEYNYKDQLAAVKKRLKQNKESNNIENGLDPFADDDDNDVRRIALEMEAKYGAGMKKKRKGRRDDYADIGMGYDESDSFIDNTDGYDEIIPQNVTTLHGGFYINCGALEFKTDDEASSEISSSSQESDDDDDKPKSSNRKRILESSDESLSDTAYNSQLEKKPKLQSSKNTMQQAIKKKLFSQNKIQVKKRRPIDPLKKTVKELLREKREDLNMSIPLELHPEGQEDNVEKDSLKENKKPMSIISVTDAIESVVKQTVQVDYDDQNKQNNDVNKKNDVPVTKTDAPCSVEGESSQETNKVEKVEVKLPENLPADILDLINRIKQSALNYKGEGKKKFFTDDVNSMLLSLERKCKILGKSSRVKVYDHLAFFIKCRRETLSRRAKNLILEDEEKKLKKLTVKLKDCINQIMPSLIINYEQESQRIIQKKFSKESIDNEENKALKMPRKRFQWSEDTRKLVKDILSIKKRCLLLEGKQKDNLEDQINQYLKTQILPLWPEGWISLNTLKKVYNNMTENSKMSHNNNSKTNPPKPHSNITITPVLNNKDASSNNKTDIHNDITLTKITNSEVRPSPKPIEITTTGSPSSSVRINSSVAPLKTISPPSSAIYREEKPKMEREQDFKKSYPPQSANVIKEGDRTKHDKDHDYKKHIAKPNITQSTGILKEGEKHRYEADHDYRISVTKPNVIQPVGIVGERPNYEKDHDYRKDSLRLSRESEFLKSVADSGVIVMNTQKEELLNVPNEVKKEPNAVISIPKATHCQMIDLTDASDPSRKLPKPEENRPFNLSRDGPGCDTTKPSNSRELYAEPKKKHPEISVAPSFLTASTPKTSSKSDGDDIQMVMENLKALQKLSSPIKADTSTGSPVSVIAYNKSFSPKSSSSQSSTGGQRGDFGSKTDFSGSFQDEFQKQFINSLQQLATNSSSTKPSYNRCS